MDDKNFQNLSDKPERQDRAIIDIQEDWPLWQRVVASIVNSFPVFVWAILTVVIMWYLGGNPELAGLRNAYLNLVVPAAAYGILSLNAAMALVFWFFPYFSPRRIFKEGTPQEKSFLLIFAGLVALAFAIVIASVA